jgi:hypothetical protein
VRKILLMSCLILRVRLRFILSLFYNIKERYLESECDCFGVEIHPYVHCVDFYRGILDDRLQQFGIPDMQIQTFISHDSCFLSGEFSSGELLSHFLVFINIYTAPSDFPLIRLERLLMDHPVLRM